jgi:hypothetical protein
MKDRPFLFLQKAFHGGLQKSSDCLMFVIEYQKEQIYLARDWATAHFFSSIRKTFL